MEFCVATVHIPFVAMDTDVYLIYMIGIFS